METAQVVGSERWDRLRFLTQVCQPCSALPGCPSQANGAGVGQQFAQRLDRLSALSGLLYLYRLV